MRPVQALALVLLALGLGASELLPPSPGLAPGQPLPLRPAFRRWPSLVHAGEAATVALSAPLGATAAWQWLPGGAAAHPAMPASAEAWAHALCLLPNAAGLHHLQLRAGGDTVALPLRVVSAAQPWPHAALSEGGAVDAEGVPVVLLVPRVAAAEERRWRWLRRSPPRGTGRALLVGDALRAWHGSPWDGLDAERWELVPGPRIHEAALVALARLAPPLPRTLIWSPGNGPLSEGAWDPAEARLLAALRARLQALGELPRLILALPPWPLESELQALAAERRRRLAAAAEHSGWQVLDLARAAGEAEAAQRVGERAYAPAPVGEAQQRLHRLLADALAR